VTAGIRLSVNPASTFRAASLDHGLSEVDEPKL